nr:MAG TPA: hypothetical protein [Caudoviricetes sp.]DAR33208.1 MAG TPA: hypothetical protein [Caudoviricetes sp.]
MYVLYSSNERLYLISSRSLLVFCFFNNTN